MLISYINAIPRYLLESYHGEQTLGYFSAIAYFSVGITIVVEALGQTSLPRLAHFYGTKPLAYRRLLGKLLMASLAIGALGVSLSILMGRELLSLFYKPEFAQHSDLLVLVMVLGTLEAFSSGAIATGSTNSFRSIHSAHVIQKTSTIQSIEQVLP